jgi:hypothetical protein
MAPFTVITEMANATLVSRDEVRAGTALLTKQIDDYVVGHPDKRPQIIFVQVGEDSEASTLRDDVMANAGRVISAIGLLKDRKEIVPESVVHS